MPTRDDQVLLEDAVNVLGNPTDISLVGSRGFQAEASPTGLPSAPSGETAAPAGTPVGPEAQAVTGGGPAATGGGEAGGAGANNLQRALQALGLAQGTFNAASKLQNLPGRETDASGMWSAANTGLSDLGFTLGGTPGAGWVDTPLGAMSQQDFSGMLDALRTGIESPSGAADLLQGGGYSLFGGGEAGGAAGAGSSLATGIGGSALAALPVILSALQAAGVDLPQGVGPAVSTASAVGTYVLPALSASAPTWAGPVGSVAALALMAGMDQLRQGMEPSEDWQTFPGRLNQSLSLENAAANYFGNRLLSGEIQNRQQLADEVARYRATLGVGPETYETGTFSANLGPEYQQYLAGLSDPFALPALPGATGTRHEGGQEVDFGPMQGALDQLMAAYQQALPAGEVTSGNLTPWTLQELGLSRHPLFYQAPSPVYTPESAGGE